MGMVFTPETRFLFSSKVNLSIPPEWQLPEFGLLCYGAFFFNLDVTK